MQKRNKDKTVEFLEKCPRICFLCHKTISPKQAKETFYTEVKKDFKLKLGLACHSICLNLIVREKDK